MLEKRNPTFIRGVALFFWPLKKFFFRVKVTGMENIPAQGACLLVANHSIGAAFEILFLCEAWNDHFERRRPAYGLTHRFGFRVPLLRQLLIHMGAVPASHRAADHVLRHNHGLLVFPGGLKEASRPLWARGGFYGRTGWREIAERNQVPAVPITISGSHFCNPNFFQSSALAYLLVIPRLIGLKQFPITLSQMVWSSVAFACGASWWVIWTVFILTALLPILPAEMRIHFHAPVPLDEVERTIYRNQRG